MEVSMLSFPTSEVRNIVSLPAKRATFLSSLHKHWNQAVVCTVAPNPRGRSRLLTSQTPTFEEKLMENISRAPSVRSAAARSTGVLGKSVRDLIKAAALPSPAVFHLRGLERSLRGPTPPMWKERRPAHWRCAESFDVLKEPELEPICAIYSDSRSECSLKVSAEWRHHFKDGAVVWTHQPFNYESVMLIIKRFPNRVFMLLFRLGDHYLPACSKTPEHLTFCTRLTFFFFFFSSPHFETTKLIF